MAHPDCCYHVATEGSFPENKAIGCEAHRSPESRAEVKSAWSYIFAPPLLLSDMSLKGKGTHTYGYNNTFLRVGLYKERPVGEIMSESLQIRMFYR